MSTVFSTRIGTEGQIAWSHGMNLGDGFDAQEKQPAMSPFQLLQDQRNLQTPLEETPLTSRMEFQHQFIQSPTDFKKALDKFVDTSTSISIIDASPAIKFLKDIECNPRHIASIIRCTITTTPKLLGTPIQLTEKARVCLEKEGVDGLLKRYGTHFISGHISHSEFYILIRHTSSDTRQISNLTETITKNYKGLSDAKTLSSLKESLKKSGVDTQIEFALTGSQFTNIKVVPKLDDTISIFEGWKEMSRPVPYIALLKHYSLIIAEIPRPSIRWKIHTELADAYSDLLVLEMKARSAKRVIEVQDCLNKALGLERRLKGIEVSDSSWEERLREWKIELSLLERESDGLFRPIELRRALLQSVQESQRICSWPLNTKMYPGQITEFRSGITESSLFGSLNSEVEVFTWYFSKDRTSDADGIVQKERLQFGTSGDRLVIGIEVTSDRDDHHNNGWFRLLQGGVGQSYMELFFETSHWRASEWSVKIWHVDENLYSI